VAICECITDRPYSRWLQCFRYPDGISKVIESHPQGPDVWVIGFTPLLVQLRIPGRRWAVTEFVCELRKGFAYLADSVGLCDTIDSAGICSIVMSSCISVDWFSEAELACSDTIHLLVFGCFQHRGSSFARTGTKDWIEQATMYG
jgi:hypothetical protein